MQPNTGPDGPFGANPLFPPCLPISWPSLLRSVVDPVIFLAGEGGGLAPEAYFWGKGSRQVMEEASPACG